MQVIKVTYTGEKTREPVHSSDLCQQGRGEANLSLELSVS